MLEKDYQIQLQIKSMSHYDLARIWRFGEKAQGYKPEMLEGGNGDLFKHRLFTEFGGFTPEISKELGWGEK